jgi:hypothetical protein
MASSVSSKRAFSLAGIKISKQHSWLKGDILEALQFLKCLMCHDLIFHADPTKPLDSNIGKEDDILMHDGSSLVPDMNQFPSWNELWLEDDDDAITEG